MLIISVILINWLCSLIVFNLSKRILFINYIFIIKRASLINQSSVGLRLLSIEVFTCLSIVFLHVKISCFLPVLKVESSGFAKVVLGEPTFILVFPASSRVIVNLVNLIYSESSGSFKSLGNCIYCSLNHVNKGSFFFNIWCIENAYKWMGMWATPCMITLGSTIQYAFYEIPYE